MAAGRDVRPVGNGDAAVTTVEAAFDGEHISVWLDGRRVTLAAVVAVLIPCLVAVDYAWSKRRGLRR